MAGFALKTRYMADCVPGNKLLLTHIDEFSHSAVVGRGRASCGKYFNISPGIIDGLCKSGITSFIEVTAHFTNELNGSNNRKPIVY